MSSIAGIDYSSDAIDVVLIDEDSGSWLGHKRYRLDCGPGDAVARARRIRDLLPSRSAWEDAGVVAIGLEATFSQAFKTTAALARAQGALIACLPSDVKLRLMAANRKRGGWKILTVGRTNATKEEVEAWALAAGAPNGLVQDAYDAFCIARAMRETLQATNEGGPG